MAKRITITFTDEEYDKIKQQAEENYRSFNDEVRYQLAHLKTTQSFLHYPPGVRSIVAPTPENPAGQQHTPTNNINK